MDRENSSEFGDGFTEETVLSVDYLQSKETILLTLYKAHGNCGNCTQRWQQLRPQSISKIKKKINVILKLD